MGYSIEYEKKGVIVRFEGTVSYEDMQAANAEIWKNPAWERFEYEIWDSTAVQASTLTSEQAIFLAYMDKAATLSSARKRRVAVIPSPHTGTESAASYVETAVAGGFQAKMFSDMTAARAWLKI